MAKNFTRDRAEVEIHILVFRELHAPIISNLRGKLPDVDPALVENIIDIILAIMVCDPPGAVKKLRDFKWLTVLEKNPEDRLFLCPFGCLVASFSGDDD